MYVGLGLILGCRNSLVKFPQICFSHSFFIKKFSVQSGISRISLSRYICNATRTFINRCPKIPSFLAPFSVLILRPVNFRVAECKHSRLARVDFDRSSKCDNPQFDWKEFWSYLQPDFMLLLFAVILALGGAVLNVQLPVSLGLLINTVSNLQLGQQPSDYFNQLFNPGLKLIGIYALQSVCTFGYISLLSVVGERCAVRIRRKLFQSLIEQDIAFFDVQRTGEMINRLSSDVQDFKSAFKQVISQGLRGATQTAGCVVSLYILSPQMTAVIGILVPCMIGVGTSIGQMLRRWSQQSQEQGARATAVADEALGNIRTVRAFAMEEKELSLYQNELNISSYFNQRLGLGIASFQALSNFSLNAMVLLIISHGGYLLSSNQITPGSLMSFLVATQTIQRSLSILSVLFGQIVRGTTAGARVFEYTKRVNTIPIHGGFIPPTHEVKGQVEFRNISFSYPSRKDQVVLDDFSLIIPAGETTAICGMSGAGKSTVAALLERFYDPETGGVYIDGKDLRTLDPTWVRSNVIGYINQEPILFATSIIENIRYGRLSATDEEVFEAAKMANAHNFITAFPNGYKTVVGERGVALSGGQKQRVAIARALLKNPKILILDEATSALDTQSEKIVQDALDKISQGRTVLVIAHRLSTIHNADSIAVINNGNVKELGKHDQLMKTKGLYYQLVKRQTTTNE